MQHRRHRPLARGPWTRGRRRWRCRQRLTCKSSLCTRSKHPGWWWYWWGVRTMFMITIMIMMTIFRHCLFHDHLVDIVVILVVGAKSHNGTQAETVWEENLKYDQLNIMIIIMMIIMIIIMIIILNMMTILIRMIMPVRFFIRLWCNLPCKQIPSHGRRRKWRFKYQENYLNHKTHKRMWYELKYYERVWLL